MAGSQAKLPTPLIEWATPAPIPYGTALGAAQLGATTSVPGTLVYSPPLGTVLSVGAQTLAVTFTPAGTASFSAATATVTIQVNPVDPALSWAPPAAIVSGTALSAAQLDASSGSVAGTFSYAPAAGTVLTAGSHTLTATFTPTDSLNYAPASASVTVMVNQATPTLTWPAPAAIAYGTALGLAQLNASAGSVAGTFSYTPAAGTVLSAGPHKLSVTYTPTDTTDYAPATASVTLQVGRTAPTLTWSAPAAIVYGAALSSAELDASSGGVAGTLSYAPAAGILLAVGTHTLTVTFTPADTADYAAVSASATLQVSPVVPLIPWATPAAIVHGTALSSAQLDATASVPGTFSYAPALGVVLPAGPQTLSVTFTPANQTDYAFATASVSLNVNRASPVLSWVPAPMTVGSALGNAQLNSTAAAPGSGAALPGSFFYAPDAATVFSSPGPQTVTVTFTPQDEADFQTVESSVSINVASFGVVAWGDSLTAGNEGNLDKGAYPADLAALITLPVVNQGIGGQGSTAIGVREGGVKAYVTVAGGTIPASGGVTITFHQNYVPTSAPTVAAGIPGSIAGVPGLVTINGAGVNIFTRTTPGAPVSVPGTPELVVDTPYAGDLPIFWEGRNSLFSKAVILNDIASQVATVPAGQDYLVMSVINENVPSEWPGSAIYAEITDVNTQLAAADGAHYLDIRHVLVESYNPDSITDVSDFSHDELPTSLRAVEGTTTLAESIGPADTTLTLNSTLGSHVNWILTLDSGDKAENVLVTAINGPTLTVVRNMGGLNTAHAAGAPVTVTDSLHLNAQGYQIVAQSVAQFLSRYQKAP
jgi:hypothetical protein